MNLEHLKFDTVVYKEIMELLSSPHIAKSHRRKFDENNKQLGFSVFDVDNKE